MGNVVDLKKLKEEIDTRKNEKVHQVQNSNAPTIMPKDTFLNGLVESLKSGQPTKSTQAIMAVNSAAEFKSKGEVVPKDIEGTTTNTIKPNTNMGLADSISSAPGVQERDHLLYEEFERKKKELSGGGALNTYQPQNNHTPQGATLNEGKLIETVNNVVENKFAIVVEQAMKDSIVEVYAKSRMRETIEESRDLIREIVIDVIRDLQKKKKPQE